MHSDIFYPLKLTDSAAACSVGGSSVDTLIGGCSADNLCTEDSGVLFSASCENAPLEAMTITVTSHFGTDEMAFDTIPCLYSTEPEAVPELDGTYRADYELGASFLPITQTCNSEKGTIVITCEDGGIIGLAVPTDICQPAGTSELVCDLGEVDFASGVVSCTGTSLQQLAVTATWIPAEDSLVCTDAAGVLSRGFGLKQKCPPLVFAALPGTLLDVYSWFDLSATCYPFVGTYTDIISTELIDRQTGQTVDVDSYPVEECSAVDTSCFPNCGDGAPQTALKIAMLPQNILVDCLYLPDSNAGNGDDTATTGAGVGEAEDGNETGEGAEGDGGATGNDSEVTPLTGTRPTNVPTTSSVLEPGSPLGALEVTYLPTATPTTPSMSPATPVTKPLSPVTPTASVGQINTFNPSNSYASSLLPSPTQNTTNGTTVATSSNAAATTNNTEQNPASNIFRIQKTSPPSEAPVVDIFPDSAGPSISVDTNEGSLTSSSANLFLRGSKVGVATMLWLLC